MLDILLIVIYNIITDSDKGGNDMTGEKLKNERKKKGKTQKQVAEDVGISMIMYSFLEQGLRKGSDETKKKIADYYEKTVDELFF